LCGDRKPAPFRNQKGAAPAFARLSPCGQVYQWYALDAATRAITRKGGPPARGTPSRPQLSATSAPIRVSPTCCAGWGCHRYHYRNHADASQSRVREAAIAAPRNLLAQQVRCRHRRQQWASLQQK